MARRALGARCSPAGHAGDATPAAVPDGVIAALRAREPNGAVELPSRLKRGDAVRILRGPFREQLALYQEQTAHERVAVLLALFGSERRLTLRTGDVEAV
jgi:transcription antitermination factor NusG